MDNYEIPDDARSFLKEFIEGKSPYSPINSFDSQWTNNWADWEDSPGHNDWDDWSPNPPPGGR